VYCAQDNHANFYQLRYPPRESPIAAEIDSDLFFNHLGIFCVDYIYIVGWDSIPLILGRVENTW
jgi:hypothetical protein